MTATLRLIVQLVCGSGYLHGQLPPASQEADIADLIATLAADSPRKFAAIDTLSKSTPSTVIPEMVRALRTDKRFGLRVQRGAAYRVFARICRDAAADEAVRELMLSDLADPTLRSDCALVLSHAPSAAHEQIVQAALPILGDLNSEQTALLRMCGRLGKSASPALPKVEVIFRDKAVDERVRSVAAESMLRIGGLGLLDHYLDNQLDVEGQRAFLGAALIVGGPIGWNGLGDRAQRKRLLSLAEQLLAHENRDTRITALHVIAGVSWVDVANEDSRIAEDSWSTFERAAQRVATRDPDPALRSSAAAILEQRQSARAALHKAGRR